MTRLNQTPPTVSGPHRSRSRVLSTVARHPADTHDEGHRGAHAAPHYRRDSPGAAKVPCMSSVAQHDGPSSRTTGACGTCEYPNDGAPRTGRGAHAATIEGLMSATAARSHGRTHPNHHPERLGRAALKLLELVEGAGDAERAVPEVHGHRRALLAHHAPEPVGLVGDPVVEFEALDHRLGSRLEGTAGEVAPLSPGSSCHHPQYAPPNAMRVSPAGTSWCWYRQGHGAPRCRPPAHCRRKEGERPGARSDSRVLSPPGDKAHLPTSEGRFPLPATRSGRTQPSSSVPDPHEEPRPRCGRGSWR